MEIRKFETLDDQKRFKEKEFVRKDIETKIKTSFIFPIDQLEQIFGDLWGQDKSLSELTSSELEMKTKFLELRKRILDNGNNQLRKLDLLFNKIEVEIRPQIEMRKG